MYNHAYSLWNINEAIKKDMEIIAQILIVTCIRRRDQKAAPNVWRDYQW